MKPVPTTIIPADGKLDRETLASILDLDNWGMEEIFTCTDGTICPHCNEHRRAGGLREPSVHGAPFYICRNCGKCFRAEFVDTPLGKAWQTRKARDYSCADSCAVFGCVIAERPGPKGSAMDRASETP